MTTKCAVRALTFLQSLYQPIHHLFCLNRVQASSDDHNKIILEGRSLKLPHH